nr:hypothetical protein [Tanacetum cinerariifolium]
MEESLSKFMSKLAKRHEENSNMIKEIQASTDATIKNQGASIKTLEIQIGQMSKVLLERGFGSFPSSTKTNLRDHVKSISTTIKADTTAIHHIGSPQYVEKDPGSFTLACYINNVCFDNAFADLGASVLVVDFIILDMPEDVKVPLILGRPFFSITHAKIDVFKRKITLRERIKLDLEARLIGETLVLKRSLDLLYGDYMELNDLNVPLELKRNQVEDLMPTFEEVKARNDNKMVSKIFGYPSDYDQDEKILIEDMDPYLDEGMEKW